MTTTQTTNKNYHITESNFLAKVSTFIKASNRLSGNQYSIEPVRANSSIQEYFEKSLKIPYILGSTYYQMTRTELIHSYTNILIQDIETGAVYKTAGFHKTFSIPIKTIETINLTIDDIPGYRIFVQSNSNNRKLKNNTFILIRKPNE